MLNPSTAAHSDALLAVAAVEKTDDTSQSKPVRKRAPRTPKVGVSKGLRLRVYPTDEQAADLRRWIGASRWLWNWALASQNAHYEKTGQHLSTAALSRELTEKLRSDTELVWLRQVPRTCLTEVLRDLNTAWQSFFDGLSGKRPDKPGSPRFHGRGRTGQSVSFQVDARHKRQPIDLAGSLLHVAVIGAMPMVVSEPILGKVSTITLRCVDGKWFASLALTEMSQEYLIRKPGKARVFDDPLDPAGLVAFDASVPHGAVATSDGKTTYRLVSDADKARDKKKRASHARHQRSFSRKQSHRLQEMGRDPRAAIPKELRIPKSRRQEKLLNRIAGLDLHMVFTRQDRIHKFTTDLVRNHHTIVVETLVLAAMAKSLNRGFRRNMHAACMGEIIRQLKYKCAWHGRILIFVDQWFPSSKRCSNPVCHQKYAPLKLGDDAWVCPHCSTPHDRDDNAAFNLWQEGWRLLWQTSTSCPTVGSMVDARGVVGRAQGNILGLVATTGKRETRRKTLTLPAKAFGMEPKSLAVG